MHMERQCQWDQSVGEALLCLSPVAVGLRCRGMLKFWSVD